MKKQIITVVVMIIIGVFLGLAARTILGAIAVPNLERGLLTSKEKTDLVGLGQEYQWYVSFPGTSVLIISVIVLFLLLLFNLNSKIFMKAIVFLIQKRILSISKIAN